MYLYSGAFNTYRKDWLTYHGGTDRLGELKRFYSDGKLSYLDP